MTRWRIDFDEAVHGFMLLIVMVTLVVFTGSFLVGCKPGTLEEGVGTESVVGCTMDTVRYPTTAVAFGRLYNRRSFLVDDVHLGRDVDLSEGTAIYPIGCGTVQVYRSAAGYGTLAVVVEHRLARPVRVRNGAGELVEVREFLSIYGHLRATTGRSSGATLTWRVGDRINPTQVLGYVQNGADNGDGAEHLHLGIRLQTLAEAQRTDASAWFRGYDGNPSQRRWFADPQLFLSALQTSGAEVTWHPPGSVLARASRPMERWMVSEEQTLRTIDMTTLNVERLATQVLNVSDEELGCYRMQSPYVSERSGVRVLRFSDTPAVYEYTDSPRPMRFTFISQEAFISWGWRNEEVEFRAASGRSAFLSRYVDGGMRRLRDGTLLKGRGQSEVSVVSHGLRLPIGDWSIFLGLGYREENIFEIEPATLDAVGGMRGPVITLDRARTCLYRDCTIGDRCEESVPPPRAMDGGASVSDVPVDAAVDRPSMEPMPGGMPDVASIDASMDVPSPHSEDAGVRPSMDAGLLDGGTDVRPCPDPVMPPRMPSMDAGMALPRDVVLVDLPEPTLVDVPLVPAPDATSDIAPPPLPTGGGMRYEFRLARDMEGWAATAPYYLRDRWWRIQSCLNVPASPSDPASSRLVSMGDGWQRCDLPSPLSPFVGSFFSPTHPESGDRGHIATIDNWPERCTPRVGIEWRITDLASGRRVYEGPASGLSCIADGAQDRHRLP